MNIDIIIHDLNKLNTVADIRLSSLDTKELTVNEKNLIRTYKPENALIVYGSLAPGESNHSVVEDIRGVWQKGIIRGKLEKEGWAAGMGYYGFRNTTPEEQQVIKASVLFSDQLSDHWPRLDEFEGDEYKRILAKIELENGEIVVGYLYAINE